MSLDFQPGNKIGKFVLDTYVGSGSFGVVWRGHAEDDDKPVAVKILTGAFAEGEAGRMRADVELLAAAAASRSAHVVKVVGGGVEPVPYIVMEFIEGKDLQTLLREQGHLSFRQAIDVGMAVSDALRALYQVGIVHRDIKPANVMIDEDGVIKLADFGIARIVGYSTVTVAGQTAMTMAYAAPEIWDEDGPFGRPSHRSDLYALGVLLYQALTGTTPFTGNYSTLYRAHCEQQPDLSVLPDETPASLRILIARCLAKRQEERPRDADACLLLLKRAEVELAEASGEPLNEPRKLGSWVKDRPHESVPWAWRCHHQDTGAPATLEVYFTGDLNLGERLADVVRANAELAPLGAERLLASSRFLLYPGEAWRAAPPGEFQFWLAREDRRVTPATLITEPVLRSAVHAIAGLVEAARRTRTALEFRSDSFTVTDSGEIYLSRPGLGEAEADAEASAFRCLLALPLDDQARRLVNSVPDFAALAGALGFAAGEETVVLRRETLAGAAEAGTTVVPRPQPPEEATTLVGHIERVEQPAAGGPGMQVAAAQPAPASVDLPVAVELMVLKPGTRGGPARYRLVLHNRRSRDVRLRLSAQSSDAVVSLPASVALAAGETQSVSLTARPRKRRLWGGTVQQSIAVSVTHDEGGPPLAHSAAFRDESYSPFVFAASGLGIALLLAVTVLLGLSGGGGGGGGGSSGGGGGAGGISGSTGAGGGESAAAAATTAKSHLDNYEARAALDQFNKAIELDPSNATYFYGRARTQLYLGDLNAAAADADHAIALDGNSAEAYYVRSLVYEWQENREGALAAAGKAIELDPSNASYYAERSSLYGEQDKDLQLSEAVKATGLDANNADAHSALGFAYRIQKRYTDAEAEYQKAIALDAKNGLRYATLAGLYYRMNDYARSLSALDQNRDLIAFYPLSDAEGHWLRGAIDVDEEKYQVALAEFGKASELVPLAPSFYNWRGYCYYLMNNLPASEADLNKAIELAPTYADAYNTRSLLRREQYQLNLAVEDVNKAIALDPTEGTFHGSLAVTAWLMNDYATVIKEATTAIQLDPTIAEAYNVRSLARYVQGQYNDALADISKAIELEPDSSQYYANRGAVYIELKNYQAALTDLSQAIGMSPDNASFYNLRGIAYHWLDNYDAAISDYSRAIQNDPGEFQYYMNRGIAEEDVSRIAEARADYQKAKELANTPEQTQTAQAALDALGR